MKLIVPMLMLLLTITTDALAKDVKVGMGNYEPYYIAKGKTGIFTDVLEAVFRHMPDHQPVYLFGRPNKRLWRDFKNGKIDAVANVFDSAELEGCKTDPVFRFRDIATTKTSRGLKIEKISDLAGLRVVAFQGAKKFMGTEFSTYTDFKVYTEVANQEQQSAMLHGGRADVSIGDMFLFLQSLKKLKDRSVKAIDFKFHDIFPALITRMGFRDASMCPLFNKALAKIISSGDYERVYNSYLTRLGYN